MKREAIVRTSAKSRGAGRKRTSHPIVKDKKLALMYVHGMLRGTLGSVHRDVAHYKENIHVAGWVLQGAMDKMGVEIPEAFRFDKPPQIGQ